MKFIKNLLLICTLLFGASAFADDQFTVDFGSEYDATNSAVFTSKMSAVLGDTKTNAMAFEIGLGQKSMRTNVTYGLMLSGHHFFKVTDDFLWQNRQFDYGQDFGKHDEKIYQNAIGAAYRYDINGSLLKGIEVSNYFSYAPSVKSSFKPEPFIYEPIGDGRYNLITFHGRLAGSKATHSDIGLQVSPWSNSQLTVGIDYDTIKFDNIWSKKISYSKFGGHTQFEQVVANRVKINSHYNFLQTVKSVGSSISVLLPSTRDMQFELIGGVANENNTAINQSYWLSKLTLKTTFWGGEPSTSYAVGSNKQDLREWVAKPVVRMHDVMVLPEMRYTKDGIINTHLNAPTNQFLRGLSSVDDFVKYDGIDWEAHGDKSLFVLKRATFVKVEYYDINGHVLAYYKDTENTKDSSYHTIRLSYEGVRKVNHTLENWKPNEKGTMFTCTSTDASACKFEVKL